MSTFPKSIFREYDIRGLAGSELTPQLAKKLGHAYAMLIKKRIQKDQYKISIGRDCRLSSDDLAGALISGLTECGIHVLDLGVCPTPLTYFSIHHHDLDGGIMVTGSHNPAEYNGFKISISKNTLHGEDIQELRVLIEELSSASSESIFAKKVGEISKTDIIQSYVSYLKNKFKNKRHLKVVLDAGNATAGTVAPLIFKEIGAEVIPLFCDLDGRFPNHHPDPTVPKNLSFLIDAVKKNKADFGVGFDGDSDRIGVVDENGTVIFGDELMILFSRNVLSHNPGATIISEVKSSYRLYEDISKKGGHPIMWKTGHSLIKSKMKETKALLAGEMSGHIFFADRYFGYDDAIYAALRLYEIVSNLSIPLSGHLSDIEKTVNTPEIRVDCLEDKKFLLVEETKQYLSKIDSIRLNTIDGVRSDFGDGWGLVRASNTQPVIVLRFEAKTTTRMNEIMSVVLAGLSSAAQKIGHPSLSVDAHHS